MSEAKLYQGLSEIFGEVFMRDIELRPELTAHDVVGWDSFKQIEILLAIEERYRIKFHARELDKLENVGALVSAMASKIKG